MNIRDSRKSGPASQASIASALRRQAENAAPLLKIMGNPVRLMILCCLVEDEYSVGELNRRIALSQSTLSQHLAVLRRNKLVCTRREAQTIFYSLRDKNVRVLMKCLYDIYCT